MTRGLLGTEGVVDELQGQEGVWGNNPPCKWRQEELEFEEQSKSAQEICPGLLHNTRNIDTKSQPLPNSQQYTDLEDK